MDAPVRRATVRRGFPSQKPPCKPTVLDETSLLYPATTGVFFGMSDLLDKVLKDLGAPLPEGYEFIVVAPAPRRTARQLAARRQAVPPICLAQHLVCPLSDELFWDPVKTCAGKSSYDERLHLAAWFASGKTTDPVRKTRLQTLAFVPNFALRAAADKERSRALSSGC